MLARAVLTIRYVDGSLLATCVAQAQSEGWNAGVMFWEWAPLVSWPPEVVGRVQMLMSGRWESHGHCPRIVEPLDIST